MNALRRGLGVAGLVGGFVACSSTSTNEGPGNTGGAAGAGGSAGSGGAPSGGAPSGGAPSGGAPSGGAPSGGGPSGGASSGGGPTGGAGGGTGAGGTGGGCTGGCVEVTKCCATPIESNLLSVQQAAQAGGVCTSGSPCETPCANFCLSLTAEYAAECVPCMQAQAIPLTCTTGSSCVGFKACLGPCAP